MGEHIRDLIFEKAEEVYKRNRIPDLDIYLHPRDFRELSNYADVSYFESRERMDVRKKNPVARSPDPVKMDTFQTFETFALTGSMIVREYPEIKQGTMRIVDQNSLISHQCPFRDTTIQLLEDPHGIDVISFKRIEDKEWCHECGHIINSHAVEGDNDELFCSIKCLRTVY